jgi:lipooligosaccharide transport system ATP-binding protein
MPPVLTLHHLTKSYDNTTVVAGIDLTVARGSCHGLLGPNGAGKTTTLRLALGLIAPDHGEITLLGHRLPQEGPLARARVGVVPQHDNLDPDFTVRENLLVYAHYFGLSSREIAARIPALLNFAGLTAKADATVATLSGGMKRRLTLARALVNDPELIILDEPTTGLDPQARHLVWQGLRQLVKQGKTLLLTTHFMDEAERLCDQLSIIDHGEIIAEGAPRALLADQIEPHVVEIYGEALPRWRAHLESLALRVETSGETLFCYTVDPAPLLARLAAVQHEGLHYLHRPANLEDLFLKLTGRDLRD